MQNITRGTKVNIIISGLDAKHLTNLGTFAKKNKFSFKKIEQKIGEVLLPETVDYKNLKPKKDGLFCPRIFGSYQTQTCFCSPRQKKFSFKKN